MGEKGSEGIIIDRLPVANKGAIADINPSRGYLSSHITPQLPIASFITRAIAFRGTLLALPSNLSAQAA